MSCMGRYTAIVILAAAAACAAPYECHDRVYSGECADTEYIWWRFAGDGPPPEVRWHTTPCPWKPERAAVVRNDVCFDGLLFRLEWVAAIAWTPPAQRLWETALAHELMHAEQSQRGVYDGAHERVDEWARVDAVNDELRRRAAEAW